MNTLKQFYILIRELEKATKHTLRQAQTYLFYVRAHLFLTIMEHTHKPSQHVQTLLKRVAEFNVNATTYTWKHHHFPTIVYLKAALHTKHTYIGYTIQGLHEREWSRQRLIDILQKGHLPNTEYALLFWARTRTYHAYSTIVLTHHITQRQALSQEANLHTLWRPSLVAPWIQKWYKQSPTSTVMRPFLKKYGDSHKQLAKRSRNYLRNYHSKTASTKTDFAKTNHDRWHIIFSLALSWFQRFKAIRQIEQAPPVLTYQFLKQCQYLEEPYKTKTTAIVKRSLQRRELPIPPKPKHIVIPFLKHDSFKQHLKTFLTNFVQRNKHLMPPLHIPQINPLESKHTPLGRQNLQLATMVLQANIRAHTKLHLRGIHQKTPYHKNH